MRLKRFTVGGEAKGMTTPENLPSTNKKKAKQEPLARVVCDYIAGMTDTFIHEQYQKFCGRDDHFSHVTR